MACVETRIAEAGIVEHLLMSNANHVFDHWARHAQRRMSPALPFLLPDQLQQAALFLSGSLRCSRVSVVTPSDTGAAATSTATKSDAAVDMAEVHASRVYPSACHQHLRESQKRLTR